MPKRAKASATIAFWVAFQTQKNGNIFHYFLPPGAIRAWIWTLYLKIMRRLFYHRTTAAGSNPVNFAHVTKA